jgi:hypothetical protein
MQLRIFNFSDKSYKIDDEFVYYCVSLSLKMKDLNISFLHDKQYDSHGRIKQCVTIAYYFYPNTGILQYGATIFNRNRQFGLENPDQSTISSSVIEMSQEELREARRNNRKTTNWLRKDHSKMARSRFMTQPVLIPLSALTPEMMTDIGFYQFRRLEQFILHVCLPLFDVKSDPLRLPRNNTVFMTQLPNIERELFNLELTSTERRAEMEYNAACMRRSLEHCAHMNKKRNNLIDEPNFKYYEDPVPIAVGIFSVYLMFHVLNYVFTYLIYRTKC